VSYLTVAEHLLALRGRITELERALEKSEKRAAFFKSWSYAARYGATPSTMRSLLGEPVEADLTATEITIGLDFMRRYGMLSRRFLWGD